MPKYYLLWAYQLVLAAGLLFGCVGGLNESYFRVKGSVGYHRSDSAPCMLALHADAPHRIVDDQKVAGSFETSFVVPAGRAFYYFTLECPGTATLKTINYQLGGSDDFNRLIDLGDLSENGSDFSQ